VRATRSWENSKELSEIYYLISRNKKQIREQAKYYTLKQNENIVIQVDNLVEILSKMFPNIKLENNKWKLIVNIADKDKNSFVDLELLFSMVSNSTKNFISHPRV